MRSTLVALLVAVPVVLGGCCKGKANKTAPAEADPGGPVATAAQPNPTPPVNSPVQVGTSVRAPWSRSGRYYSGRVTELYGKLAHIRFNDGDAGWAPVTRLRPTGIPMAEPTDPCAFSVGDRVRAPWSKTKAMYKGIVAEVHGKLARISFLDGDKGWARCSEMRRR